MKVIHRSPVKSRSERQRTRSAGSSSVSSYDVPLTPIDAYDGLHDGRLGASFSVIKMDTATPFARNRSSDLHCGHESSDDSGKVRRGSWSKASHERLPLVLVAYRSLSSPGAIAELASRHFLNPYH